MAQVAAEKSWRPLVFGLLFGIAFGFLLQKGGVGKFHVLIGQLILRDFTVVKVMLTAVATGMVIVYLLKSAGKVELKVPPTRYGSNVLGGLIFGVGFALAAYCPGTNMVALGQGNFDALAVAAGLIIGSYLFAMSSARLDRTVMTWGDRGQLTVPDLLRKPATPVSLVCACILVVILVILERYTPR